METQQTKNGIVFNYIPFSFIFVSWLRPNILSQYVSFRKKKSDLLVDNALLVEFPPNDGIINTANFNERTRLATQYMTLDATKRWTFAIKNDNQILKYSTYLRNQYIL